MHLNNYKVVVAHLVAVLGIEQIFWLLAPHLAAPHQDLHHVLVQAHARTPIHHLHRHHLHHPHPALLDTLGSQKNQRSPRKDGIVTVAENIISAANVVAAPTTTIAHAEDRAGAAVTTIEALTTSLVLHHLYQYQQYRSKHQHQAV
jgi:hypothetical protein